MKNLPWVVIISVMFINGCVVPSNYYSGKTIDEGKFAFTVTADDIYVKSGDESIEINKSRPFTPSVILTYGLPYRFETSVRYIPKDYVEGVLRYQINPRSYDLIDCSLNIHYGYLIDSYSYLKYGVTMSKSIAEYEPYINYSAYKFINALNVDISKGIISGSTDKFIDENRSIGFGVGIPLRNAKLYPEINYQYYSAGFSKGLYRFGIGFRVFTNW